MARLIFILIITLFSTLSAFSQTAVIDRDSVEVKLTPDHTSPTIDLYNEGETFEMSEYPIDGWVRRVGGGYVHQNYISEIIEPDEEVLEPNDETSTPDALIQFGRTSQVNSDTTDVEDIADDVNTIKNIMIFQTVMFAAVLVASTIAIARTGN